MFNAPIKSQCSRDYFYGKDLKLEKILDMLEGEYARLVRDLECPAYRLNDDDRWLLRRFISLQSARTAEKVARGLAMMQKMYGFMRESALAHGQEWIQPEPTAHHVMMNLMRSFSEEMGTGLLDDLKMTLIKNETSRNFVTSDNPAILTNRWHLQKLRRETFGKNSAGLLMMLPLGSRLAAMAYDQQVYSVKHDSGFVNIQKESDVLAINEHQFLQADAAIYFSEPNETDWLVKEFEILAKDRSIQWDAFDVASYDLSTATHDRYAVGPMSEVAQSNDAIFHLRSTTPSPSKWPSFVRFRDSAHGYTRGRSIVRRAYMEADSVNSGSYRRVKG